LKTTAPTALINRRSLGPRFSCFRPQAHTRSGAPFFRRLRFVEPPRRRASVLEEFALSGRLLLRRHRRPPPRARPTPVAPFPPPSPTPAACFASTSIRTVALIEHPCSGVTKPATPDLPNSRDHHQRSWLHPRRTLQNPLPQLLLRHPKVVRARNR